jgi:hypothetical protein
MIIKDIYKKVKPTLIKGATVKDLLHDIQATAWQYAYLKTNQLPRLKKIADILKDNGQRNALFMDHYTQALAVLKRGI